MKIRLNKYTAESVVNAIRHAAMTMVPVLRPIAFAVGSKSNVLEIGDFCEEDMTEFIAGVCAMKFGYSGSDEVVKMKKVCDGVLHYSDFNENGIKVLTHDAEEVLHLLTTAGVEVYFRYDCGVHSKEDNSTFLEKHGVNVSNLVVINSRHSVVSNFYQNVLEEETTADEVVYELDVWTTGSVSSEEVISRAAEALVLELQKFGVQN